MTIFELVLSFWLLFKGIQTKVQKSAVGGQI